MRRKLLGDDKKHTRPTVSEDLFRGLDDLRACSISLYVMSERTKFALSFRDIFEEIMNATVGNLILRCGPDSSEILYRGIGLPPAIFRKPLKHFHIESNYIEKSDDDKLEDEERLKRKGHLTRSAIPKGLSHLLLHPPGLENDNNTNTITSNNNKESKVNDEKVKENEEEKEIKEKSEDDNINKDNVKSIESVDINNRILPPPIKLPLLPQQNRMTSSLNSKNIDNDLKSITNNHYNLSSISLKRKYSKTESDSDSMISSFSKRSSPGIHNLSPIPSKNLLSTNNINNLPTINTELSPSNVSSWRSPNSVSNISSNLIQNNTKTPNTKTTTTPSTSSNTPDSNVSLPSNISDFRTQVPEMLDFFPFVGGTNAMISNISTWTEQSGQQIPQTGLTKINNNDDNTNNANNNNFNNNKTPTTNNNNNFNYNYNDYNINNFVPIMKTNNGINTLNTTTTNNLFQQATTSNNINYGIGMNMSNMNMGVTGMSINEIGRAHV